MHTSARLASLLGLSLSLASAAACGPSVGGDDDDVSPGPDARVDAAGPDGPDANFELPSRVYAHSGTMLYRIDTATRVSTPVGSFTNLPMNQGMQDIAVDRNERMIGVTRTTIHEIDESNATTMQLATYTGANISSLSFVPANPAQPDGPEMLIAATETGEVLRIDINDVTRTATTMVIGNYGQQGTSDIGSSGDIVYVKDFGAVATVNVIPASNPPAVIMDSLARLDPTNGWRATVIGTNVGFDKVFGLAFWGGKLFGFADNGFEAATGSFIEINPTTGASSLIETGSIRWFGAGVTTIAPLIP